MDEALTKFFKKLDRYSRQFSRLEEQFSDLVSDLSELMNQLVACDCQTGKNQPAAHQPRKHEKSPLIAPQAWHLKMEFHADGSADVCIDDGSPIYLPAILADLLTILADKDTGWSEDRLVGWKSYETVRSYLKQKASRDISRKAIHQNIFRLRQALEKQGGLSPRLIQTNPRLGIRFALRKNWPLDELIPSPAEP